MKVRESVELRSVYRMFKEMIPITSANKKLRHQSRHQPQAESRLESRLESKLAAKVVLALWKEEQGKAGLAQILGHKSVSGELNKQIKRLLNMVYIERTIPEKATSRLQQYRLTEKGRAVLEQKK